MKSDRLAPSAMRRFCAFVFLPLMLLGLARATLAPSLDPTLAKRHIATDYESFWSASTLILRGKPILAYDTEAHRRVQDDLAGEILEKHEGFFYPPSFLLLCAPLALLPFGPSAALWLGGGAALYVLAAARREKAVGLAYPGALLNALYGQNAFLSAALFGLASPWLEIAPLRAGLALGALSCKPQLAALLPVLILARRDARLAAGMAISALTLAAAATAAFGPDIWVAWWRQAPLARRVFENGLMGFGEMASLFAGARRLGTSLSFAYAVQGFSALLAGAALWRLARRADGEAQAAMLAACSPLATPFILDYDLLILAVPLLWLFREASRDGFLPGERVSLVLLFLSPLLCKGLSMNTGLPCAAAEPLLAAGMVYRRGMRFSSARQPPPSAR